MKFNQLLNQAKKINAANAVMFSVILAVIIQASAVFASSSGSGMPWEGPLETVKESITGPFAYVAAVVGIVATGVPLIFGAEIQGVLKAVLILVLVMSIVLLAAQFLSGSTGVSAQLPNSLSLDQITQIKSIKDVF